MMTRILAKALALALALLLLGSVPVFAWDEYPPGPRFEGHIGGDGKGDGDPDDFPIVVNRNPQELIDHLLKNGNNGYVSFLLRVWGLLPY